MQPFDSNISQMIEVKKNKKSGITPTRTETSPTVFYGKNIKISRI
jgi:hypothetical protein